MEKTRTVPSTSQEALFAAVQRLLSRRVVATPRGIFVGANVETPHYAYHRPLSVGLSLTAEKWIN